ncbi:MAG: hypothetical protein WAL32_14780 [Terriglobales bacterium]
MSLASIYSPLGKCNWQSKPEGRTRKPLILAALVKLNHAAGDPAEVLPALTIMTSAISGTGVSKLSGIAGGVTLTMSEGSLVRKTLHFRLDHAFLFDLLGSYRAGVCAIVGI